MNSHDDGGVASATAPVASVRTPSVVTAAKLLHPKGRKEQSLFLVEGPQAVREALAAGAVTRIFATDAGIARCSAHIIDAREQRIPVVVCDEPALSKITGAVTPQGIVATCTFPAADFDIEAPGVNLVVCLDRVSDPGNVGTIIRTADAAGADAVLLSPRCADPFNEKSVRSTTGSIFHIPVLVDVDLLQSARASVSRGLQVFAADARGTDLGSLLSAGTLAQPTIWVFGSEAHGVDPEIVEAASQTVAIPIFGAAESLNVASAAAVCAYASAMAQAR